MIDPTIFKAYDIRGIVGKTLTADVVRAVGRAVASEAKLPARRPSSSAATAACPARNSRRRWPKASRRRAST